jgi:hypothetical protein
MRNLGHCLSRRVANPVYRTEIDREVQVSGNRRLKFAAAAATLAGLSMALTAAAEPLIGASRGTFGLPGLIDMPTAESASDGVIGFSTFFAPNSQRHSFSFQVTPRLTGVLRYSKVEGLMTGGTALFDRSFDMQFRLLDETRLRPAIAIGLRDFIGTGVYSSEYVVATKSLTPTLRVSAGLGWGRLGSSGSLGAPFGARPVTVIGTGGRTNSGEWFRGDVAPFFGLAWQANDRLTLKAEYSSDAYAREVALGGFRRASPVNLALDYRLGRNSSVSAYYLYGSEVGVQFSFALDPRQPPFPSGIEKTPLPVRPRPDRAADPVGWSGEWAAEAEVLPAVQASVAEALAKDGIILESMALSATRVEVRVRNETYGALPQALGHTARVLTRALPPSVEQIVLTTMQRGMPASSVTLSRSDLEALENGNSNELLRRAVINDALAAGGGEGLRPTEGLYPRFQWALAPYGEASIFDPDDPFRLDLGLSLSAKYEIVPGVVLSGNVRQKLVGNLDASTRVSNSVVQHVRSDLVEYQRHGDLAVQNLTLAWYAHPAENIYSRVTVGLLERMYGGVSGELLWKPVDSRLALGAELNFVRQRDFDQHFTFRDYQVMTGHASAYYDIGNGFTGRLDVGRYLAQDWGATLTVDREFANGWSVGAFATITDMPASSFGEGSFDKGIRLTIPVAWTTGTPSVNRVSSTIRSLNRDGGARLDVEGRLYDTVRQSHVGNLYGSWGRFWR